MIELDKYKDAFLTEAKQHIASMESSLLNLEKNPAELQWVDTIFRAAHTLKSMAATMNYNKTAALCHAMEDVLDTIRKKSAPVEACMDLLLESIDTLGLLVKQINGNGEEADTDEIMEKLQKLLQMRASAGPGPKITSAADERTTDGHIEKIQNISVSVGRLDVLMNLGEELLINRMRLNKITEEIQHPELTAAVNTLDRLVSDMQYHITEARMVPIKFVFNRFPRMVRDLAKNQKKEVNLETHGAEIELDRVVIDEIGESLVHLLRNAIDHGIETPEERKKAGKPELGTIRLRAARTKNFASIEISDDGAGIDVEEVKNIALKRGVLSGQETGQQILDSIFFGMSTTKEVTKISGRGLGLKIVKKRIESIGGSVRVESTPEKGTTFLLEIPLTLAIIKALFVKVGARPYAIPVENVEKIVTINSEDIEGMLGYEAIVLNEENIPITRLDVLFGNNRSPAKKQPVAIVRKGKNKLGLTVDAFLTAEEIVAKPLNKLIKENNYFSGFTIIGSGEVVLILDLSNVMLTGKQVHQNA